MRRGHFPADALPAWCVLNGVKFKNVSVSKTDSFGLGLVAEQDLPPSTAADGESPTPLLKIPGDLVLSSEAVEQYAKQSKEFRELLDATGHQSTRGDVLLFLLNQLILSSPDYSTVQGVRGPWTQYLGLLPTHVPVPTLWSEPERALLIGTSLEPAVSAKLDALTLEFDRIREKTSDIEYWYELLEIDNAVTVQDWILLDALYRSRSLALPVSGESMVPCLDLVNHSNSATAFFEQNVDGEVVLMLSQDSKVSRQRDVTINYGHDKPAAEMLFSYGFIDPNSAANTIVLPVESMPDDPLAKAKRHVFGKPPTLKIISKGAEDPDWSAPFMYLMCLNEEDGLGFKILQETDGSQQLRMFWQDNDVTEQGHEMERVIEKCELYPVFRLRVITIIQEIIYEKLEIFDAGSEEDEAAMDSIRPEVLRSASHLKSIERDLFQQTYDMLEQEKTRLFEDESVLAYLQSMDESQENAIGVEDYS